MDKLCIVDHYPSDSYVFSSHGYDLLIGNKLVAEAFSGLSATDQSIAEKRTSVTTRRITIFYNCIGPFSVPDRREIPTEEITMGTRKGVAASYSPEHTV